jgi:hypothetical protein
MTLSPHQFGLMLMAMGVYFVVIGLTAKTFISESDIPATEEERSNAKATPTKRIVFTTAGVAVFLYGLYLLLR